MGKFDSFTKTDLIKDWYYEISGDRIENNIYGLVDWQSSTVTIRGGGTRNSKTSWAHKCWELGEGWKNFANVEQNSKIARLNTTFLEAGGIYFKII